jgi:hypothetical protein
MTAPFCHVLNIGGAARDIQLPRPAGAFIQFVIVAGPLVKNTYPASPQRS